MRMMDDDEDFDELNEYGNELEQVLGDLRMAIKSSKKLKGEAKKNVFLFLLWISFLFFS